MAKRRYLDSENHHLHDSVQSARDAVAEGGRGGGGGAGAAFKLFDNAGRDALNRGDMKNMNRYLGFPSEDKDVDRIMQTIDADGSGTITFEEFETFVGRMGGTPKLFEERHKRIMERRSKSVVGGLSEDPDVLASSLRQMGLDQEAQTYWRMVVPHSEFGAAAKLIHCQKDAIATIRRLAKKNHQEALPTLQTRVHKMGYPDDHLWLTLAWIRELAPIIIHLDLKKMLQFLEKDTHYKNQFETATSGGLLKPEVRKKWERDLFAGCYDKAPKGGDRPKYGVQNVMNDHRGVIRCAQYGESYLILKDTRLRCTFSPEDSANLKAEKLAVLDFYAHVLNEYSEEELKETIRVANSADAAILGDSQRVGKMKYKEAQIHGEVRFDSHVERLVASTKHRSEGLGDRIQAMCKKHGFGFSWMDEEQERLKSESMHRVGGAAWEERLQQLQESGGDFDVPEGFCRVGCGRRVAPGVTRAGNPFTTCCRGCIMGFGHDRLCGQIDATKVGPGLCKVGCGRKVAQGEDTKGRPFMTCCRGCPASAGAHHDWSCQKVVEPVAAGMCKMGVGGGWLRARRRAAGRSTRAAAIAPQAKVIPPHALAASSVASGRRPQEDEVTLRSEQRAAEARSPAAAVV
eukprot:CAMPEP_0171177750 /NCGR_PEP_ID=MMETSP0790-20130122/12400_1 /TAXON_ID=2925 /ORGANISM="Alexandrium catenella, Strain OF101" /LENGTH=628 /DNA_ID=CAMNT_0011642657 /DNA_START=16 /DNA_END=1904 /DNA_ORIENTATION=-